MIVVTVKEENNPALLKILDSERKYKVILKYRLKKNEFSVGKLVLLMFALGEVSFSLIY